jgi:hypothetical protein
MSILPQDLDLVTGSRPCLAGTITTRLPHCAILNTSRLSLWVNGVHRRSTPRESPSVAAAALLDWSPDRHLEDRATYLRRGPLQLT